MDGPLQLESLRGRFVLLDFWTYCCINCMHVLPELQKLEAAYPTELVVIGVHSAKFAGEKVTENIRAAILRYEISHPVVNDGEMVIWNRYGVQSWPTLVLIDPRGEAVWLGRGEQKFETIARIIDHGLPYYREQKLLAETPLKFSLERDRVADTPLLFPGKVLVSPERQQLYLADSNHNRIVVSDLAGHVVQVYGTGQIGHTDGTAAESSFNHPQGMALHGSTLFVADTENHLLRAIDLDAATVRTVAGTGVQARSPWPGLEELPAEVAISDLPERWVGPPRSTALSSPWALAVHEGNLFIAMAGPHQIWSMPLIETEIGPYAGNGREDIVDGPLLPRRPYDEGFSSFAQPSGLAIDQDWLYVADSEGSSIRRVPLAPDQPVRTLVGTSALPRGRLFIFGDRDGEGLLRPAEEPPLDAESLADRTTGPLLQHPLGVAVDNGLLYVADTYNNKIKVIDLQTGTCRTLAGTGIAGHQDGPPAAATFDEPAGLSAAGGMLYVADTNNHAIRTIDLKDANRVSTLELHGLETR